MTALSLVVANHEQTRLGPEERSKNKAAGCRRTPQKAKAGGGVAGGRAAQEELTAEAQRSAEEEPEDGDSVVSGTPGG